MFNCTYSPFTQITYIRFDCVDHNKLENVSRDENTRPPDLPPEKRVQVKKQQLEPDMEKRTVSELGKEYVKAVCCQPCLFHLHAELNKPPYMPPTSLEQVLRAL